MTPIQLQYKTGGSPGPRVAFKSRTHWAGTQTEATVLERVCSAGGRQLCCAVRGGGGWSARQPTVLAHGCALGSGTVKHTGHRGLGWTSIRRWITAAHPEAESAFGEPPSLTMPITRRAADHLGGCWKGLENPTGTAGLGSRACPWGSAHVAATGKECLAWPGVSVLTMTTACGGMNSVQGQGATATPP